MPVYLDGAMRDLGLKGESTFTSWCADVGLIPNGSKIDKTGWDFLVEFPFSESAPDAPTIHNPAIECKIQVKATDKTERKLPISLSNLRRLATAQMPAFLVFIEYDRSDVAKRAFIVHIYDRLTSRVLKRIHEVGQSNGDKSLNKRTLTIHYDESNQMSELNGKCLRRVLLSHIGNNIADYVAKKRKHLESTGFEDGFAQIHFDVVGEDNLRQIIDASLGIEKQVNVENFRATYTRFGIISKSPFINEASGRLEIPAVKPASEGFMRFKESKLSDGLSFKARLYTSPFYQLVPNELRKIRLEGDFFDIRLNPYTGAAEYTFSLGQGVRLSLRTFRDAAKLITLLSSSGNKLFLELDFEGFPTIELKGVSKKQAFDFSEILLTLECAEGIVSRFDLSEEIDIALREVTRYENNIRQFHEIMNSSKNFFKVDFRLDDAESDITKEVACIFPVTVPIGSHILGVLMVLTGEVGKIEAQQYRLTTQRAVIEKKFISRRNKPIRREDLAEEINAIAEKYKEYNVVMIDNKAEDESVCPHPI